MKRTIKLLVLSLLIGGLLFSCFSSQMIKQDDNAYPQANSGKAAIVIYRPQVLGLAAEIDIYMDTYFIGSTSGGTYFITQVEPGDHYVMIDAEIDNMFKFTAEAGKVYFAKNFVFTGFFSANSGFATGSKEDFDSFIENRLEYQMVNPDNTGDQSDSWDEVMSDYQKSKRDKSNYNDALEMMKGY